jgi:hypothetical protein
MSSFLRVHYNMQCSLLLCGRGLLCGGLYMLSLTDSLEDVAIRTFSMSFLPLNTTCSIISGVIPQCSLPDESALCFVLPCSLSLFSVRSKPWGYSSQHVSTGLTRHRHFQLLVDTTTCRQRSLIFLFIMPAAASHLLVHQHLIACLFMERAMLLAKLKT